MSTSRQPSICMQVSGPQMMSNLRSLAKWTKLSGSSGEMESLRFVQKKMEEYGFRTNLLLHDAYISLPGKARVLMDGEPLKAITHSFSRPTPPNGLTAALAYVGQGSEADFAKQDVRGKIVLIEGIALPQVARRASLAGAAGQLQISPHKHLHEMCISPVWGSPSPDKVGQLPSTVVLTVSDADGGSIRDRLARGEAPTIVLEAEVDTGWRKTPILVAEIEAPKPEADAPYVMFSGHHDTWYFGVMDNGAANVTTMEVARLCAESVQSMRRGLRVFFWSGHSHGRYSSSAWYADTFWDEIERRCVAHLNIDSTGGVGSSVLRNAQAMSELIDLAAEAVHEETGETYIGARRTRAGDESFGGIGVPSMFGPLSEQEGATTSNQTKLGWWWHTPDDLIEKVDESSLVRDTKVVAHAIWRLVAEPIVPLNYRTYTSSLLGEIEKLKRSLGDRFCLDTLTSAAKSLDLRIGILNDCAAKPDCNAERINRALLRLSRVLVPFNYTSGDRFEHEPAVPLPAWQTLHPLHVLAASPANSDAARFQYISALRARNRALLALRGAVEIIDVAIADLGRT